MDHDRLFKELLTTFFIEFLELFFSDMVRHVAPDSIEFLDKEVFTDVTEGERHEVDLIAKAKIRDELSFFLIHVENQATAQADFARRMFSYFARLHEKHGLPVYPIALFSYDQPQRAEPDEYRVEFSDLRALTFRFQVVQLNRLAWQGFVERTNPVAAALMARMRIEPTHRPEVKAGCLRLLAKLQLDPARRALISGFVDAYLRLTIEEEKMFQAELDKMEPREREQVMEIVTSWMEQGIEKGIERGKQSEALLLVVRMLHKRLGSLEPDVGGRIAELSVEQLESLAEALLDFTSASELASWLDANARAK
jgi:hypothetical protein